MVSSIGPYQGLRSCAESVECRAAYPKRNDYINIRLHAEQCNLHGHEGSPHNKE